MTFDWDWVVGHVGPVALAALGLWLKIHYGHHKINLNIDNLRLQINGNNDDKKPKDGEK